MNKSRLSWNATVIATIALLLTLTLFVAISFVSSSLKATIAQKEFARLVENNSWNAEAVSRYLDQTVYYYWYGQLLGRYASPYRRVPAVLLYRLKEIVDSLYSRPADGMQVAEGLMREIELNPAYGAILQIDATPAQVMSLAKSSISEYQEAALQQQRLEHEMAALEERIRGVVAQHAVLGQALTDLFSLPDEYERERLVALLQYNSGVLAGLPRVKGLPDEVADAQALQELVARAGGTLSIDEGPDTPLLLLGKLQSLKRTSDRISESYGVLMEEKRLLDSKLEQNNLHMQRKVVAVRDQAIRLFALISKVSPRWEKVFKDYFE